MISKWSNTDLQEFVKSCGPEIPAPLAHLIYATRLLGKDPDLVLHGGGNTSLKAKTTDLLGEPRPALFVKASGRDMAAAAVNDFCALDFEDLNRLRRKGDLDDGAMAAYFRLSLLRPSDYLPSIETFLHCFLPFTYVCHTHPAAILACTNRHDAASCLREAFGTRAAVVPYARSGIECGRTAADAVRAASRCSSLVIMRHGLVTWGETAKEAYEATVKLVSLAETYLAGKKVRTIQVSGTTTAVADARAAYAKIAPLLRGALSPAAPADGALGRRVVLRHIADEELLAALTSKEAAAFAQTPPLSPDYLIRVRRTALFVESPDLDNTDNLRKQIAAARQRYRDDYGSYALRGPTSGAAQHGQDAPFPAVLLLPGVGAICAGETPHQAGIAADITKQALAVKRTIFETGGTYEGLSDDHLVDMEFRSYQQAKLGAGDAARLAGTIVFVTGAAGAIGAGLCEALLAAGAHVAAGDLGGEALDCLVRELGSTHGSGRILGVHMDVTDPSSVEGGFRSIAAWAGGLDCVVVNAGAAHVSTIADMDLDAFRKLEKVNIEGTLLTLRAAAGLFTLQNTGGDIVVVSTKNVFAPGASFGAYSATKAAAHQLGRIASLELAPIGVRVNMVAPDAVFSHGGRKSGLWAAAGPERMRSRGLDEAGLEEYYRSRNLLKAKITANHVAAAALFFITRQTPTTGATIPVDGGLPDSTPR